MHNVSFSNSPPFFEKQGCAPKAAQLLEAVFTQHPCSPGFLAMALIFLFSISI